MNLLYVLLREEYTGRWTNLNIFTGALTLRRMMEITKPDGEVVNVIVILLLLVFVLLMLLLLLLQSLLLMLLLLLMPLLLLLLFTGALTLRRMVKITKPDGKVFSINIQQPTTLIVSITIILHCH